MRDKVVSFSEVSKSYGTVKALQGISFCMGRGEVLGFLGHNGAGKTTSIRLVLGLLKPDDGNVSLFGYDPYPDDGLRQEIRRKVGVVLEEDSLYPYMSGRENLTFWASLHGLSGRQAARRVDELLQMVHLSDRAEFLVGTYAKGMKRKLALARALVNYPELLVMDEPTAGLDPEARVKVRNILKELVTLDGTTVFLTSHDLDEVQKICERIIILEKGQVVLSGTMKDLLREERSELIVELAPMESNSVLEPLIRTLRGLPFLEDVNVNEDGLRVTLSEDDHASEVIKLLANSGIRIREIRRNTRSLEEVYLDTVRRHESMADAQHVAVS